MEPLSLANARARRCTLLPLPHARRAPVRLFSFFLSFFHSLTAAPSCPPLRHASPPRYALCCVFVTRRPCRVAPSSRVAPVASRLRHASPLSRRAFVMRRPCRVAPSSRVAPVVSSCVAPVASCRTFATPCAFVTPRLAMSRRLVQTCGGNGGECEWRVGRVECKRVQASAGSLIVDSRLSCSRLIVYY
jgi:hypothetical protein